MSIVFADLKYYTYLGIFNILLLISYNNNNMNYCENWKVDATNMYPVKNQLLWEVRILA